MINYKISIFLICIVCGHDLQNKSKNVPPFSRKSVEEIDENTTKLPRTLHNEPQGHLVSILVKNMKEIFQPPNEPSNNNNTMPSIIIFTESKTYTERERTSTILTDYYSLENSVTLGTRVVLNEDNEQSKSMHISKGLILLGKAEHTEQGDGVLQMPISTLSPNNEGNNRSCIFCNNVETAQCEDPKFKLVPSIICERDDDLCYSMHTPFGVIDRGCYNVNHNLTTYVCSCNLCNYISIADLPYMFSTKRDWADNVIELSRTRNFRNSIFKDMSCIRCESNITIKANNVRDNANCLEGNVGALPIEECQSNEICGIKSIKGAGYIWRGCIESPLYNNWWMLCDDDLCNHDTPPSLYDIE